MSKTDVRPRPLMFKAACCMWQACDFDDVALGCKGKSQVLCLTREISCAVGEPMTGCGLVTNKDNKECCKIGLLCCAYGLKEPETCCKAAGQFFCLKEAAALPLDEEYVGEPVFALYCLSCLPEVGCCVEAPRCRALERPVFDYSPVPMEQMDRGLQMEPYRDHAGEALPVASASVIKEPFKDEF
ncbi:expressed unknown protein [Seminavis robusta]|uniref:Uncharacterized protein n=1 Tax=Seminavis robusta TaxID=568900 RepID=A0A9N8HLC4_9STRA|nr:expressed unknown protein [Seminavis robusta]|eukprot:Sro811_g205890.1 n/a (185) ;mRNA; r:12225-12779